MDHNLLVFLFPPKDSAFNVGAANMVATKLSTASLVDHLRPPQPLEVGDSLLSCAKTHIPVTWFSDGVKALIQ